MIFRDLTFKQIKTYILLVILLVLSCNISAQNKQHILINKDTTTYFTPEKNMLRASTIGFGVNIGIWSFSRYITHEDFAYISLQTLKRNLRTYPVWDSDKFSTNLIGHPYHGSLYYNAARANGYSFYGSIPFTLAGSLMWEFAMENEPPSRNDLISTTFGGVALGEITFRLSDLILDNRTSGANRFWRELFAGIIAPTRLVNRLATGKAWQYSPSRGNYMPRAPIKGSLTVGARNITDYDTTQKYGISTKAGIEYGEIFDYEIEKPYEWFQAKAQLDFVASSFSLTQINIIGALQTYELYNKNNWQMLGGVFQHFNYFNSKVIKSDNTEFRPYYISEAASVGAGLIIERESEKFSLKSMLFANGIALGASISDHFEIDSRDYNMGSGFSLKGQIDLIFNKKFRTKFKAENYNIYTWMGYDEGLDFKDLTNYDKAFLDTQGDKSVARLYLIGLTLEYDLTDKLYLGLERYRYIRKTRYKYMPDVSYKAWDDFLHLGFIF